LSTNTDVFIVIIAHEIGFRAFAYPARRRTVSQLGIVSNTSKSKIIHSDSLFIMGIRKTIASGLIAAAHHLQHDRSKEQLIRKTNDVRRKIARFIEPN
tara:strand:- start:305 stop:598 length:294 start_codon:yes stop_codon:yes gene_type:complete